jgi:hypothetical protein
VKQLAKGSQDPNIVKEVYGTSRPLSLVRFTIVIGLLLCAASMSLAQTAGMVRSVASIGQSGGLVKVIPFAPVVACGYPANTSSPPCSNLVTTFTTPTESASCPSNAQAIWPASTTCQSTADASGNFQFFINSGTQNVTYFFKYLSTWFGPYVAVVGGGGSGTNNVVFTGTLTTPITNGGIQCLHVDNGGVLSGTGVDCGAGGTGGGGTVSQIGTPLVGQISVFTDTTHIAGSDKLTVDGTKVSVTGGFPVIGYSDAGLTQKWSLDSATGAATVQSLTVQNGIPESQITNLLTDLAAKAPLVSPTFSGTVTTGNLVVNGTCTGCGGGGSGTVTSVATTYPITGGPFSTTGTAACPDCAFSVSPGAGIAHFAGGTQALTSSAVVDADLSGPVGIPHGGTNATTAAGALVNLMPSATRVGDVLVCTVYSSGCTTWALVPGNNTGSTAWLQESSAGAGSWTVPSGAGTVAVVGAGSLTSTALMTGGGTQLTQTPCATCTLDASGNLVLANGGSIGTANTGTPKLTITDNLITANAKLTGTIFNASTGFAIPTFVTAGHYLRNNGTNFVDSAILAGDLPDLAGTYLKLSGGGTMNGNILFTDGLYNVGAPTGTRPAHIYAGGAADSIIQGPTINATTGFQVGGTAPIGHFLSGTGIVYADNGRLNDDGNTLSYSGSGGIQASSLSITTGFQVYSLHPAPAFTAVALNDGLGFSNDGNLYASNNGGTPSQVLTAATNTFDKIASGTSTGQAFVMSTGSSLVPTSGTVGQIAANALVFGSTTLTAGTLPADGQCYGRSGTTTIGFACSGGAAGTFQTNAVNLTSSSTINFQNSNATNGLTLTFANPSAGNVKLGVTGTLNNAGLTNSSTTVNGANCALGSACNVETAAAGQLAVSGGAGASLTGASSLTYSGSTLSTTAGGVVDLSAATGTAALFVPSNVTNTASAAGVLDYDTTLGNFHVNNGADSVLGVIATASIPSDNRMLKAAVTLGKVTIVGTGFDAGTYVRTAGTLANNGVVIGQGTQTTATIAACTNNQAVFGVTSAAPTCRAIAAADLPVTLSASTAITNAVLTTPDIGTPSAGTLTNVTGLPIGGIVATGTPSATTYLRGDGTWAAATGSNGLSTMTPGGIPVAATSNTITSTIPKAGSGAGITTGPTTSTTGDVASFTGTGGQLADSAVLAANLVTAASNYTSGQFIKAAGANKTTSSAAIVAADLPAALDNSTSINGTSVALGKTLVYSDSTSINGTTIPASATLVTTPMTDATASSLDTAFNLTLDTGASSFHSPFTASIRGTAQLQVCFQAGPNGQTVVGSAVACSSINQTPFAKFIAMTNTAAHNNMRLYQNATTASGTMLEMNNASTYNASTAPFYFFKANTGVTGSDTGVGSGVLTASLRGDGLLTLGANGGTGGSVVLNGSTSGSATINTSATGVLALPSGTTATNMSLTTPALGTPSALVLTNATGLPAAQVPAVATVVDTASPVTVSTTASSEYHFNQHATTGTAMTYNLPTAAAGKQFCISNSNNGSAANTGVITIAGSAAGQFIIFTDGTLSATGGNVTSGGAAADAACVVGVDATHWMLYVQRGTWTKH